MGPRSGVKGFYTVVPLSKHQKREHPGVFYQFVLGAEGQEWDLKAISSQPEKLELTLLTMISNMMNSNDVFP